MSDSFNIDPAKWPKLEGVALKPLYVNDGLEDYVAAELQEKGWQVIDVRTLPSENMAQRQTIVLAWLEGIRQGTIQITRGLLDYLDLEAQITGLKAGKQQMEAKKIEKGTLDSLLDFRNHRVRDGVVVAKEPVKS